MYRGKVGQLQEVVNTNVAHFRDIHSSSQIFLGCHSLPDQTQYFAAMQSTDQHQDEHLVEPKSCTRIVPNVVGALICKRSSSKSSGKAGEM
jgi:hypothetical protein